MKVFSQPPLLMVKYKQINALAHHDGGSSLHSQVTHPRAAHNLLGYTTNVRSFIRRKQKDDEVAEVYFVSGWLRPELSFEDKTKLFEQYKILNGAHEHFKSLRKKGKGGASSSN